LYIADSIRKVCILNEREREHRAHLLHSEYGFLLPIVCHGSLTGDLLSYKEQEYTANIDGCARERGEVG